VTELSNKMKAGSTLRKIAAVGGIATFALVILLANAGVNARSQAAGGAQTPSAPTPRSLAPLDLTGYWVSVVTEDWRFRMIVPDKGDYSSVPLNPEGRKVADSWDPAKDQAEGNQCRSYGAAALLRIPGRLHIEWENDNTLRVDTDSGGQTRLLHFGAAHPAVEAQWQGYSLASWEGLRPPPPRTALQDASQPNAPEGYLKVVTDHMKPGYLRKNGVPYSANASLEEYFDSFKELNGDVWLVVTSIVTDPQFLTQPFITSTHFKKLASASGWDPTSCRSNEPR
jgi:hypothetical protein